MKIEEMKEVTAETQIECNVECPHCGKYQDRLSDLSEHFDRDLFSAKECDTVLSCDSCNKEFIVTEIIY